MKRISNSLRITAFVLIFLYLWYGNLSFLRFKKTSKYLSCAPRRKIGFLKIHKCASSTIQNIFLRYAYANNINIAVPPEMDENYLGNPKHFRIEMLQKSPGRSLGFEMFLLHTRWKQEEINKVLGQDAFYVTMLRNPVDLFESLFSYGNLQEMYGTSLEGLIRELRNGSHFLKHRMRFNGRYGWNQISWDFGMHPNNFKNHVVIEKFINEVEQNFHLVMIAERMEESLILLKNKLCWPTESVTTLKLNARKDDTRLKLNIDQRRVLEKWLAADMTIYEHFSRKFDREVKKIPKDELQEDVKKLRSLNAQLAHECVVATVTDEQIQKEAEKPFSNKTMAFQLKDNYRCKLYGMKENLFLDAIRTIQAHREYLSSMSSETF